jgi:hypothetical protein
MEKSQDDYVNLPKNLIKVTDFKSGKFSNLGNDLVSVDRMQRLKKLCAFDSASVEGTDN